MDPNIIQTLPNHNGSRGPRLEIDEFIGDNEMTNLFLVALYNLQRDSVKEDNKGNPIWANFYGISSIHGVPDLEAWNGISKSPTDTGSEWSGYCHHGMETFPTWHRPYIYLIERVIYIEMIRVAELYREPDKSAAIAAAGRFRLPYWDFIMPRNRQQGSNPKSVFGVPQIFQAKEVTLKLPDPGKPAIWRTRDNPLYSFKYPTPDAISKAGRASLGIRQDHNQIHTARCPDSKNETSNKTFIKNVQDQAVGVATSLWQLLVPGPDPTRQDQQGKAVNVNAVRDWTVFSNHDAVPRVVIDGKAYTSPSLEGWHDRIHGIIGKGTSDNRGATGVMGDPATAAFDPIFYMHHNNIDRLLSLYQALFVDKYIKDPKLSQDLIPFFQTSNHKDFVKSSDPCVRDYWAPGFAMPGDKPPGKGTDLSSVQKAIAAYLSNTYYWATNGVNQGKSLPNWPKLDNVKASWALNETPEETPPPQAVTLEATALKISDGIASLVFREATIPELEGANIQPESSPELQALELQDTPIETSVVMERTNAVDSQLPDGAFESAQGDLQTTWNAHVKVRKYAFDGSFNTHLFVGEVDPNDPEAYMRRENEVGFAAVFARYAADIEGSCDNCARQRENDVVINEVVPITPALYKYLDAADGSGDRIQTGQHQTIRDLSPEIVVPFLKEQLSWRMVSLSGTEYTGQEQQAGLEIRVSSRPYILPTADNPMGLYGPETDYPEITNDKPGGSGYTY